MDQGAAQCYTFEPSVARMILIVPMLVPKNQKKHLVYKRFSFSMLALCDKDPLFAVVLLAFSLCSLSSIFAAYGRPAAQEENF
jgi:hypothetical protein